METTTHSVNKNQSNNVMIIKPYSKKELCALYGISKGTLRSWFKPYDDYLGKNSKLFDIIKVEFIFTTYGYPKNIPQQFLFYNKGK